MVDDFNAHGVYTVSNAGGFLVEISDSGDAARLKDNFGSDNPEITDWIEIVYEEDEDDPKEFIPVINHPLGMKISLNQVMKF